MVVRVDFELSLYSIEVHYQVMDDNCSDTTIRHMDGEVGRCVA